MARRRNYTTDQLKGLVDEFVQWKNDYSSISATALADYCNGTLHLTPAVTYQTFTRNKDVMQYIEDINTRLHERMLVPETRGAAAFIDSFIIDDTAGAEEIRQKAYEELERREALIRDLQSEYNRCAKELASVLQERDALLDINKDLRNTVQDQKKEISSLNKEVKEGKAIIASLRKYVKEYLYDPIVLRRVSQLGWVSDKKDAVKRCGVNTDIITEIEDLYKVEDDIVPSDSKQEDVSHPTPSMKDEQIEIEVVDSASAAFLSQLRRL